MSEYFYTCEVQLNQFALHALTTAQIAATNNKRRFSAVVVLYWMYVAGKQQFSVQVFGKVIHILPGAATEGSLDHVDYYLFCMRALAGNKAMQTLFTADGVVNIPTVLFPSVRQRW